MPEHGFLQDLAVVMVAAAVVTVTFRRLRQPVVLGYMLAGLLIGPHVAPISLISDEAAIHTLAELGLVFMLFTLGLEFHLERLREVGVSAALAALFEIPLMLFVGYSIGQAFHWNTLDSIFLGAMVSISSTTIIVKTFGELGLNKQTFTEVVFGILIFEDVVAVLLLALLSTIGMTGWFRPETLLETGARLLLFVAITLVAGYLAVPLLMRFVGHFKSNEMLLVTTLGLCFGLALIATELRLSSALGAFIMGSLIARTRHAGRVELLTEPIRDLFVAVFFVAVGLMIDPQVLVRELATICLVSAAVFVGKTVACTAGALLAGNDRKSALRAGMSMGQIGEFSFIIASLGVNLKVISPRLYPIAVSVSVITTLLTPYAVRATDAWVDRFERWSPRSLVVYLDLYHAWTQRLPARIASRAAPELKPLILRAAVNVTLIAISFLSAAALVQFVAPYFPALPRWVPSYGTLFWLATALLTLPLYVGTLRKLWTITRLIAELGGSEGARDRLAISVRTLVATVLFGAAVVALMLLTLILSATILPPARLLIGIVVLLMTSAVVFRHRLSHAYARLQVAVHDKLERPAETREVPVLKRPEGATPTLLDAAKFEKIDLQKGHTAVGRGLEELALRRRTGASVVAIERAGKLIVNPPADQPLAEGDRLVLLGDAEQVAAARGLLEGRIDA
ncbi:MAG: cation:proton antiporter [Deltaproteobacteria bacterium]|nr:cation:proton antiporter [Deltaproteobacteria bacterium]